MLDHSSPRYPSKPVVTWRDQIESIVLFHVVSPSTRPRPRLVIGMHIEMYLGIAFQIAFSTQLNRRSSGMFLLHLNMQSRRDVSSSRQLVHSPSTIRFRIVPAAIVSKLPRRERSISKCKRRRLQQSWYWFPSQLGVWKIVFFQFEPASSIPAA